MRLTAILLCEPILRHIWQPELSRKNELTSMLASLEVRVPFLDETILDRILPLPVDRKIIDGQLKGLLMPIAAASCQRRCGLDPNMDFGFISECSPCRKMAGRLNKHISWGESNLDFFYSYLRRLHSMNISGNVRARVLDPFVLIAWAMANSIRQ